MTTLVHAGGRWRPVQAPSSANMIARTRYWRRSTRRLNRRQANPWQATNLFTETICRNKRTEEFTMTTIDLTAINIPFPKTNERHLRIAAGACHLHIKPAEG